VYGSEEIRKKMAQFGQNKCVMICALECRTKLDNYGYVKKYVINFSNFELFQK